MISEKILLTLGAILCKHHQDSKTSTETRTKELTPQNTRCKEHQNIVKVRSEISDEKMSFYFKPISSEEVLDTIITLKNTKGSLHYSSQNN